MVTIVRDVQIEAPAGAVWAAVRDYAGLDRLVPGFVVGCDMIEAATPTRRVRFANGTELIERMISCDDATRRLVWNVTSDGFDHHNGALTVVSDSPATTRVVWTADLLPDSLAETLGPLMQAGLAVMQRQLAV